MTAKKGDAEKSKAVKKGDAVEWSFGRGTAHGKVEETFTEPVHKPIKGKTITRNATPDKPAALVKTDDGKEALKSASELRKPK